MFRATRTSLIAATMTASRVHRADSESDADRDGTAYAVTR